MKTYECIYFYGKLNFENKIFYISKHINILNKLFILLIYI